MSLTAGFRLAHPAPTPFRPDSAMYRRRISLVPSKIGGCAQSRGDLLVRELAHEADAAGDLQRLVDGAPHRLAGEHLAHRGFDRVVAAAAVDQVGDHPHRAFGREAVDRHLAELLAAPARTRRSGWPNCLRSFACALARRISELHAADRAAAQAGAAVVQDAHGHLEALADRAQHVFRRHPHVGERDRGGGRGADAHQPRGPGDRLGFRVVAAQRREGGMRNSMVRRTS